MASNTEIFLEKWKEMEQIIRAQEGLKNEESWIPAVRNRWFYNNVKYCDEIRNLVSHNPKINGQYPVDVNQATIDFIQGIIDQLNARKKCKDICVPLSKIYSCKMTDAVRPAIETMKHEVYTLVPILEDGLIVGVFDENSIFEALLQNTIIDIDDMATFESIRNFLSLKRTMEEFMFVPQDMLVEDLYHKVNEKTAKKIRVAGIFLTKSGRKTERILGLLTPWDLPQ